LTITVSFASTVVSSVGLTVIVALDDPAGITMVPMEPSNVTPVPETVKSDALAAVPPMPKLTVIAWPVEPSRVNV
jgi:hypothetical protein